MTKKKYSIHSKFVRDAVESLDESIYQALDHLEDDAETADDNYRLFEEAKVTVLNRSYTKYE